MLITSLNETRGSVSEMSFQFSDLSSMRYLGRRRHLLKGTRLRGQFALAIRLRFQGLFAQATIHDCSWSAVGYYIDLFKKKLGNRSFLEIRKKFKSANQSAYDKFMLHKFFLSDLALFIVDIIWEKIKISRK